MKPCVVINRARSYGSPHTSLPGDQTRDNIEDPLAQCLAEAEASKSKEDDQENVPPSAAAVVATAADPKSAAWYAKNPEATEVSKETLGHPLHPPLFPRQRLGASSPLSRERPSSPSVFSTSTRNPVVTDSHSLSLPSLSLGRPLSNPCGTPTTTKSVWTATRPAVTPVRHSSIFLTCRQCTAPASRTGWDWLWIWTSATVC